MKLFYKIKKYFALSSGVMNFAAIAVILLITSCEPFTEVGTPKSELTGASVYQDVSTANAALADIYARLREGGVASGTIVGGTLMMANYSDDMDFYGTSTVTEQFNKHTILASNSTLLRLWAVPYAQIYAINAFIEGVEGAASISGQDRDRLLGEALFLRAFNYFYLVNIFGDIPHITTTDYMANSVVTRTASALVWQKIIADLKAAEVIIPQEYPTTGRVRANKATVQAMLARVYLYNQDYAQAEAYASAVIDTDLYGIEPDPALVFLSTGQSIIWSFHPGIAGQNTKDATTFNFSSGPPTKPSLSANLYNAFETGDIRQSQWIKSISNSTGTWYRPFKYKKTGATASSEEYTILLRLEEQYLIRAEARAMTGNIPGAQSDLNVTRNRAGLPDTSASTTDDLRTAIIQERRFEFFTEQSHRWFDLKRTNEAASVLSVIKPNWRVTDVLFPIPDPELLLNENLLPQNPGY